MAANNSNSSSFRVSCRAHFDAALTGKENKEALKAEVVRALAGLGLAIDEGDVRFHHFKLVHKKNKKPKFVVMGMDVVEGPAMAKMKAGAFAEGGPEGAFTDGAFTVRWGAASVSEPVREAKPEPEPEPGTSARVRPAGVKTATKETSETSSQRVGTPPATKPTKPQHTGKKAYTMATSTSASSLNDERRLSGLVGGMGGAMLAGVVCVVGLGGALLMGYQRRGLVGVGVEWGLRGLRGGRGV